jgi:hypothetical protein
VVEVAESGVGVAEPVEGVAYLTGVAEAAEQGESLYVVVDGLLVVAGVVGDVAQAVRMFASPLV